MNLIKQKITNSYLEEMQKKRPMVKLTFDVMLKSFFARNVLAYKRFLNSVAHLNIQIDEMNLTNKNTELPLYNFREYSKRVDFYTDINGNIFINLELNNALFKNLKFRNRIYQSKKISLLLKRGAKKKDIEKLEKIQNIQLNLNVKDKSSNLGEDIVVPYSIVTDTIYLNNEKTYIRYLDYYRNLYYNGNIELTEADYWLALLTSENYIELNEILSKFVDDDFREEIVRDVIALSNDENIFDIYDGIVGDMLVEASIERDREEEKKQFQKEVDEALKVLKEKNDELKEKSDELKEKKDELKEKDKELKEKDKELKEKDNILKKYNDILAEQEKKKHDESLKIAKKMLMENIDIDIISKCTGIAKKELLKIK